MIPLGMKSKIVQFLYQKNYDKLVKGLLINQKLNKVFLDIGSGLGFLKPVVEKYKGHYVGLEPRKQAIQFALNKYKGGHLTFHQGFFPEDLPKDISSNSFVGGGCIVSLTTLDEVKDKNNFLQGVYNLSSRQTKIFIAVRNKDWLLSRHNEVQGVTGDILKDLNVKEYKELFYKNGFDCMKVAKTPRPLITSFTMNGIKNFIIIIIEKFISIEKSYMVGFLLKKI